MSRTPRPTLPNPSEGLKTGNSVATPALPVTPSTRWRRLVDVLGADVGGRFALVRVTGELAYAPAAQLFVVDLDTGNTWPLSAVVRLLP